jgi:cupin superfamily protein DUF985
MSKDDVPSFVRRRTFLKQGSILGAALLAPSLAARSEPSTNSVTPMADDDRGRDPGPAQARAERDLRFRARDLRQQAINRGGRLARPFADGWPAGSALYFMMTPAAPVKLHRIKNDQLYHYYLGDPIELLMLHGDGTHTLAVVGPDLRASQSVQLLIRGNTFHTARIIGQRHWFLGASTEWPVWFQPKT